MRQFLDVGLLVFLVELLEDGQKAYDEMRTVYWEVCCLILAHYTIQTCVVSQVLEHGHCKDGEEARHALEFESHGVDLVHRVYKADGFGAYSELL